MPEWHSEIRQKWSHYAGMSYHPGTKIRVKNHPNQEKANFELHRKWISFGTLFRVGLVFRNGGVTLIRNVRFSML